MNKPQKPPSLKAAKATLKPYGVTIYKSYGDEFRVNFKGGREATAYYTNDISDAVATGQLMAIRNKSA